MMLLAYVFCFGKQQAWFVSSNIQRATMASLTMIGLLIVHSSKVKRSYISFRHYGQSNILYGSLLIAAQGMFMGASAIQSIFTNAILGYNWMVNSSLSLMSIPGMIAAGIVSFHWNRNKLPLKMYIFSGFSAYLLYVVMLYFMMVPELNFERWFLPQFLNGYAMCSLFIAIWIYTLAKVPQPDMLISVNGVMLFRSFIAIAFFSSLFSWIQYRLQWQSVNNLAFYFDGALMSNSPDVGNFKDVQLSAVLAANKKLLGYIIIAGLALLTFILFHRFGRLKYSIARHRAGQSDQNLLKNKVFNKEVTDEVELVAGSIV